MAQTKVSLIKDSVIVAGHLHTNHGITTDHIGEGENRQYFTTDRVQTFLTTNNYIKTTDVSNLESVTSLSLNANILSYVDEAGNTTNIDLSLYLDDSNLARIVSGSLDSGTGVATFTRDDSSTFTVDFSAFLSDANDYVTSASFNTTSGVLTLTRLGGGTVTVDLDGKYSVIGHTHAWSEITGKPSTFTPSAHNHDDRYYTETEVDGFLTNSTEWNTAYGWGDHSAAGYLTSFDITTQTDSKYLRSDANDSTTGELTVESGIIRTRNDSGNIASIRFAEDTANDHVVLEYDGTGSGATNYFHMYSNVSGWATKGSSFNLQPSTGDVNIGGTNFGYKFRVDGSTYLGKTTIEGTANANDPTLRIISTTSNTFNHAVEAFNSNLTAGEHNIVLFGKEGNTKNSGYIGYYWSAAGSNNNFVTIGHWGEDDLFRVYPDQITGNSSFRAPIFYDIDNTGYYTNPASTSVLNQVQANNYLVNGSHDGNFGFTGMSWGGSAIYPTLFSSHADRWVMHIKPHIVWTQNGQRGYTGTTEGSMIRFEGNLGSTISWDAGCLTDIASAGDYWGVARSGSWAFYSDPSLNLHANSSMRAPIFYDSNNTAYYFNGHQTTNLNALTVNGTFTVVNGTINMNNNDGFVYDDGANVMKVKYDGTEHVIWTAANDGSGSGLDADLLDGYDSSRFFRRQHKANATVGGGWITVAGCQSGRHSGEIIVTDADSGDHAYIRIHWMRSYADSNFTVVNTGGHGNRITGARVLYQTSDNTYGWKFLQVYVTASSNYEVNVYELGDIADFGVPNVVTPVVENSKSGYALHGNELLNLDTYGFATEEGVRVGSHLAVGGTISNDSIWINDGSNFNNYNENIRLFNPSNNGPSVIAFSSTGTGGQPTTSILGYSDRLEQRFGANWQERVRNGYVEASGSYRAPIFYDSDNTGYYTNPASTSNMNTVQINGTLRFMNYGLGVTGTYTSTRLQTIFNMDDQYSISADGSSASGAYGLYWSHQNAGSLGGANNLASHGILIIENGSWKGAWGGGSLRTPGDARAPIFYDYNNTGYYVHGDSVTNLNAIQGTRLGVSNSSSSSRYGISLYGGYNSGEPTYGLLFTGTSLGSHGKITGDWATYFTMNNDSNRGWIFRRVGSGNCASISAGGHATFDGSVTTPFIDIDKTSSYGPGMDLTFSGTGSTGILIRNNTNTTTQAISFFYSSAPQGARGSITVSSTSTAYNTSSDYRLKENLVEITDGIERVKLLQPKRFNFIGDDKTVDGFVAHEAQEVVPEAVTGVKDGVDHEGNPEYQGIDQAKLVPLLTAALQEAIAKIESLEVRLQAIENQ